MLTWLKSDLSSNSKPWLIALWHHAPYSKGNHDSDIETAMTEMRQNANKMLEDYGVDLVFAAHSNDYERSFLIDGAYGLSSSFTSSNIKQSGSGRDSVPYRKNAGAAHAGTVYTVIGSSAFTGGGLLNHPANYTSQNSLGSVVLDVNCAKADAKFIKSDGTIGDYFTLRKTDPPPAPTVTSPANGSTFTLGTTLTLSATASTVTDLKQIQFFYNGNSIARDSSSPYSITWKPSSRGTYTITAVATDQLCVSGTSPGVTITVN
jgi:hypothetical protein